MKSHRLAKWLLQRDDAEVFLELEEEDKKMEINRKLLVTGVAGPTEDTDNKLIIMFQSEMTTEENREYYDKKEIIQKTHPDRINMAEYQNMKITDKERAIYIIREAIGKGYTILPADDPKRRYGVVIYKEIDGIEIAYNPMWDRSEGSIEFLEEMFPQWHT